MHEVLVNRLGGLSLPRKSVVRLTDRPDMTLDVYCGRKTTNQQQQIKSYEMTTRVRSSICSFMYTLLGAATLQYPELRIREGIEDYSQIIFLIPQREHML